MSDSEEEIIIAVNFTGAVPAATETTEYKVIGLDTDEPIFQYGRQVFKGQWKDVIGTNAYFSESIPNKKLDPIFQQNPSKQYDCQYMTKKMLKLESFLLTPKENEQGTSSDLKNNPLNEDEDSVDCMDLEVLPLKQRKG